MTTILDADADHDMTIEEAKLLTRTQRSYRRSKGMKIPNIGLPNGWTAEREAELRRLFATGMTAGEIAHQMPGISRNAIIGKARRLRLGPIGGGKCKGGGHPKSPLSPAELHERRMERQRKRRGTIGTRAHRKAGGGPSMAGRYKPPRPEWASYGPPLDVPAGEVWQPLPGVAAVTLLELTDAYCRWPLGEPSDMLYCGAAPAGGEPYCGSHCRLAYRARMVLDGADRGE